MHLSVTEITMAESVAVNITSICEVIPDKQPEIIIGSQSYLQVAVCTTIDGRKICYWKCKSSDMTDCKAVLKTTIIRTAVIDSAGGRAAVTREQHVEIPDSTNGIIKIHNHSSTVIKDILKVTGHPCGNIYLPPTLWR